MTAVRPLSENPILSAWLQHQSAIPRLSRLFHRDVFIAGALDSAAALSKCAAASMSSAADRGPGSQPLHYRQSTLARIACAGPSFGAAFTNLADSALSSSSFHHSGLATSLLSSSRSMSKAYTVALAQ